MYFTQDCKPWQTFFPSVFSSSSSGFLFYIYIYYVLVDVRSTRQRGSDTKKYHLPGINSLFIILILFKTKLPGIRLELLAL